jgi:hypothetical protein
MIIIDDMEIVILITSAIIQVMIVIITMITIIQFYSVLLTIASVNIIDRNCSNCNFFAIPFYFQSVQIYTANCVKLIQ